MPLSISKSMSLTQTGKDSVDRSWTFYWIMSALYFVSAMCFFLNCIFASPVTTRHLRPWPPDLKAKYQDNFFEIDRGKKVLILHQSSGWPWKDAAPLDEIDKALNLSADDDYKYKIRDMAHDRDWFVWVLVSAAWLGTFGYFQWKSYDVRSRQAAAPYDWNDHWAIDGHYILAFIGVAGLILYLLQSSSMLSPPADMEDGTWSGGYWRAHFEFFTTAGVLLAVVGSIYAVFAKRRADEVFGLSQVIRRELTSFFDGWESVTGRGHPKSVLNLIDGAERSLIFFLGSPLIRYFRSPTKGRHFASTLSAKLTSTDLQSGFSVQYFCWSEDRCNQILSGRAEEVKEGFESSWAALSRDITALGASGKEGQRSIFRYDGDDDPTIRFVIADDNRAIFWILDETENPREGDSSNVGGFTTDNTAMITLLKSIAGKARAKYEERYKLVDTPEPARTSATEVVTPPATPVVDPPPGGSGGMKLDNAAADNAPKAADDAPKPADQPPTDKPGG